MPPCPCSDPCSGPGGAGAEVLEGSGGQGHGAGVGAEVWEVVGRGRGREVGTPRKPPSLGLANSDSSFPALMISDWGFRFSDCDFRFPIGISDSFPVYFPIGLTALTEPARFLQAISGSYSFSAVLTAPPEIPDGNSVALNRTQTEIQLQQLGFRRKLPK